MSPAEPISIANPASDPKRDRPKPTKSLPTDRITFLRQLDILRAYAAASAHGSRPVMLSEVAEIVKSASTTVSILNPFLISIGLLQKSDAGFLPNQDVVAFLKAFEWNPDTAAQKLAPTIKQCWFAEALLPRLTFGPMEEEVALSVLGEAASAGPDRRREIRLLLEYLTAAGIVSRDGNLIKAGKPSAQPSPEPTPTPNMEVNVMRRTSAQVGTAFDRKRQRNPCGAALERTVG